MPMLKKHFFQRLQSFEEEILKKRVQFLMQKRIEGKRVLVAKSIRLKYLE